VCGATRAGLRRFLVEFGEIIGDDDVGGERRQIGSAGREVVHRMAFWARLAIVPFARRRWQD
jgi:hypothetical protein